jgi:hypothetical protein
MMSNDGYYFYGDMAIDDISATSGACGGVKTTTTPSPNRPGNYFNSMLTIKVNF